MRTSQALLEVRTGAGVWGGPETPSQELKAKTSFSSRRVSSSLQGPPPTLQRRQLRPGGPSRGPAWGRWAVVGSAPPLLHPGPPHLAEVNHTPAERNTAQPLANKSRKQNKRSLYKNGEVGHAHAEDAHNRGMNKGRGTVPPHSPPRRPSGQREARLSVEPCLLTEPRPSGLQGLPGSPTPALPSGMSSVPCTHGC